MRVSLAGMGIDESATAGVRVVFDGLFQRARKAAPSNSGINPQLEYLAEWLIRWDNAFIYQKLQVAGDSGGKPHTTVASRQDHAHQVASRSIFTDPGAFIRIRHEAGDLRAMRGKVSLAPVLEIKRLVRVIDIFGVNRQVYSREERDIFDACAPENNGWIIHGRPP